VTNDDVRTLERFAKRRKVDFPLLSDQGSKVISAFNLFNDRFPEGSRYYGTSVPQVVVVNPDGVVTHTFSGHGYTSDEEIKGIVEQSLQGLAG
jgi:peroxiredoxin